MQSSGIDKVSPTKVEGLDTGFGLPPPLLSEGDGHQSRLSIDSYESLHLIKSTKGKRSRRIDLATGANISNGANISPIMAPIHHTLPTELMARIFKAGAFMPAPRHQLPFLLLVSRINRHWRDVVLNAPDVWTNVQWYVLSRPFPVIWFERSKSCLLDITLHAILFENVMDISMLIPHFGRCRRFVIEGGDRYDVQELIKPLRDVFAPHLKYVELNSRDEENWPGDMVEQHFVTGRTPNILSVQLRNICLQYSPHLSGVQTLDIHGWSPNSPQFRLLAQASSLKTLVLRECMLLRDEEEAYAVIEIPSLLSLAIGHPTQPDPQYYTVFQSLVKYLRLPNLEYLEMVHATFIDLVNHFPIDHQEVRYPKLRTLRLDSLQLSKFQTGESLIYTLPTVSHLQLINTEGERILPTGRLSTQTSWEVAESPRWPNLHTITLETDDLDNLTWLYITVSTRIEIGRPLGRVYLSNGSHSHIVQLFEDSNVWLGGLMHVARKDKILGIIWKEDQMQQASETDDNASDSLGFSFTDEDDHYLYQLPSH